MQCPRQRDVVDVVTGLLCQRPVLAPARHPAIDETRIAAEARLRADAQAFGHTGAKTLDKRIGFFDEAQHRFRAARMLEIDGHRAPAPIEQLVGGIERDTEARVGGAVETQNLGAQVGEQHGAERCRADAR